MGSCNRSRSVSSSRSLPMFACYHTNGLGLLGHDPGSRVARFGQEWNSEGNARPCLCFQCPSSQPPPSLSPKGEPAPHTLPTHTMMDRTSNRLAASDGPSLSNLPAMLPAYKCPACIAPPPAPDDTPFSPTAPSHIASCACGESCGSGETMNSAFSPLSSSSSSPSPLSSCKESASALSIRFRVSSIKKMQCTCSGIRDLGIRVSGWAFKVSF
jgi:hypothetical protein